MTIVIDSTTYDVPVSSLKCKGEFLDKYAERTDDGVLHRELIGVYFNYQLTLGNGPDYAALWQKLTEAVTFHSVTVPDEDGDFTFNAYFSNISHTLVKAKGSTRRWKGLTVNFIAQSPANVPTA